MTGVPELLILRLLADREMYGYELVQAIGVATGEAISIGEGVVYPILHTLEKQGCLKARRKLINGRTRVYYAATGTGMKRLGVITDEWNRITNAVLQVVKGPNDAAAAT
jgi:PadR family transcriptional regulator, regulatory protein PadR